MLLDTLKNDILTSLKKGDAVRVQTLRFLISAIRNVAIAKYGAAGESAITDADVLEVIKKQAKSHKESILAFTQANRTELVEKENKELVILEAFLPKEMPDDELRALLLPVVQKGEKDFGLLMREARGVVQDKADGGRVAAMIKTLLAG